MPLYEKAPDEVSAAVAAVIEKHHKRLADADVKVDCVFARAKVSKKGRRGPGLKLHGYPCAAVVRIVGQKDRAMKRGDAEIVFDGDEFHSWSEDERDAIIDHELTHLELKRDKQGSIKDDDLGRPLLKMRLHTVQLGWFAEVANRHGNASVEVEQGRKLIEQHGQTFFPWMEVGGFKAPGDVAKRSRKEQPKMQMAQA